MKKLKPNQIGPWCTFCKDEKVRATYRDHGFTGLFCCNAHRDSLIEYERKRAIRESHCNEADFQSWGKL